MHNGTDKEAPANGKDPRLALVLASVFGSSQDATMELTVVVDGAVLSGSVVSEQAWTQRQNDQVRIGSWAVAGVLDAWESATDESGNGAQPQYIHFLGPVLLSGGVRVPLQATRVDVRRVAAWSIGRIPGD
ncbi:hypothetical protein [Arthrobacter sp. FW306-07-I]|uniref:hypothetical protein n=1 Tax=Arthrobacter sp. FW306-07-I TaxID=2879622 RepID=UPI001F37110A|nr:hypothetical protein [Arthrobacter sp. FW306-07-I]UKA75028.1 hypothetical protein LFT46_18095 [Arthrobacter sp. FW306-07-I]